MSRARIEALAMVNWKGVFYERYQFDKAVTALEGDNGAGKTTVMIAAYVALFPEISKLRFTNLGEHEATKGDRGIYGRLGREGWPSFTVLDLRFGRGERLLAGVKIERKHEPVVELEPFLVTGLGEGVRLQDVLLDLRQDGDRAVDRLLDKTRLNSRVALHGGKTEWVEPRQYFRRLFDLGVTPLRLDSEEERVRFNEMLRTSMIGGISRTLSGGLRNFVLREDSTLADSLRAMKDNLSACQATRHEVEESSLAQREISDVYESAERMFTRAVHAARARSEEQTFALGNAIADLERAERQRQLSSEHLDQSRASLADAVADEARCKIDEKSAEDWYAKVSQAAVLVSERAVRQQERNGRLSAWEKARDDEAAAAELFEASRLRRDTAVFDRDALSVALADSRKAWREIGRRAGLHEESVKRHAALVKRVGVRAFAPSSFVALLAEKQDALIAHDSALTTARRSIAGATTARQEFNAVHGALEAVVTELARVDETIGGRVEQVDAWSRGQEIDALLRDLRAVVATRVQLGQRLREATQRAEKQAALRERLQALGLRPMTAADMVALAEAARREAAEQAARTMEVKQRLEAEQALLDSARKHLRELEAELPRWRATQALARNIGARVALPTDVPGLHALEDKLRNDQERLRSDTERAVALAVATHAEADSLASSGGGVRAELIDACEVVEGELVVRRFDDVPVEDAAATEALLGPLRSAILVRDPTAAAAALISHGDLPDDVWLVATVPTQLPGERHQGGVVVHDGGAVRVGRNPARPVLGAQARQRRVAELRALASEASSAAARDEEAAASCGELVARIRELANDAPRWLAPDAEQALEQARRDDASRNAAIADRLADRDRVVAEQQPAQQRADQLTRLVPDAHLLDAGDAAAELDRIQGELHRVQRVAPALERCKSAADTLVASLAVLREVPPTVAEVIQLTEAVSRIAADRDREDEDVRSLEWLSANAAALEWTEAPGLRADAEAGEQALMASHGRALSQASAAEEIWRSAEDECTNARLGLGQARNALDAAGAEVSRLEGALGRLGVGEPSQLEVDAARDLKVVATRARELAEQRSLDAREAVTRADIALGSADGTRRSAEEALARAKIQAQPARDAWAALGAEVESRGLAAGVFAESVMAAVQGMASVRLSSLARDAQVELRGHLQHAKRSAALLVAVDNEQADDLRWEHYLRVWQDVRAWVRERVPPNVSESADPVTALRDLGRHLTGLRATLLRQEDQLRGASSNVATNIGQSIKRARVLINRLKSDLETVHFGSILKVDVQATVRPEMNALLDALRGDQAQTALFQPGVTLENALAAIYLRETGGRIAGDRLLDYREYLELSVRVQREGSVNWEVANATRMSTGEAIGVGAALMMVVLTAWERRETLGRAARQHGSIRFLFLDEANRLSQDNLRILFDLCDNLQLQLLVAAPEVAQSEGNITYRLVRHLVGTEMVVDVSGRRTEA